MNILVAALWIAGAAPAPVTVPPASAAQTAAKYFVLTYKEGKAWIPGRPMQQQKLSDHARYMRSLQEKKLLVAAGPLLRTNGGMAIVRAPDQAAADAILSADPAVVNGTFEGSASEWLPVFGAFEVPDK